MLRTHALMSAEIIKAARSNDKTGRRVPTK